MTYKILAVDDDPRNLMLIEGYLEDDNFDITTATDGKQGWEILSSGKETFDLVLLDRMMPNMNGMELLSKIKETEDFKYLPVIMQTAAAEKSQVLEGIKAGVYHYLTKPYDEETLISIVRACIHDQKSHAELQQSIVNKKKMLGLIKSCYIEFKTLDEAREVATYIATLFPEPEKVVMGISELLINGVEHGNLGIKYDEKSKLNAEKTWESEVERLLDLPENQNKTVKVTYTHEDDHVLLKIVDEGEGFDWKKYMELSPERATDNHGRGIAMANTISFEKIEYFGCGNEVVCTISIK